MLMLEITNIDPITLFYFNYDKFLYFYCNVFFCTYCPQQKM